ncbi:MAG: C45 family autoproteolytic acyltransferase/hydrolase [Chloroflexota bacterium]
MQSHNTVTQAQTRFPELEVSGSPREMGRQTGEAFRELVRGWSGLVVERFNTGSGTPITHEQALGVARSALRVAEDHSPDVVEELRGVAEGAGVSVEQVMLVNVKNQLSAALRGSHGCTTVAAEPRATEDGAGIIGQNWNNDPAADEYSVVLTRRPLDAPASMSWLQPGVAGYMGVGETGMAVCLNAMPGQSRAEGLPWYFIVRRLLESRSLDEAVSEAERGPRAIPANAGMMTPQGAADLEVMIDRVGVLRADEHGIMTHTNHCLHPDLQAVNSEHGDGIFPQSYERCGRAAELLRNAGLPVAPAAFETILSDHEGFPRSICRHPNDDERTGHLRSVVSLIMESDHCRMLVSRGNPCERPYEEYRMG